jgi:hypothetical protein
MNIEEKLRQFFLPGDVPFNAMNDIAQVKPVTEISVIKNVQKRIKALTGFHFSR